MGWRTQELIASVVKLSPVHCWPAHCLACPLPGLPAALSFQCPLPSISRCGLVPFHLLLMLRCFHGIWDPLWELPPLGGDGTQLVQHWQQGWAIPCVGSQGD